MQVFLINQMRSKYMSQEEPGSFVPAIVILQYPGNDKKEIVSASII